MVPKDASLSPPTPKETLSFLACYAGRKMEAEWLPHEYDIVGSIPAVSILPSLGPPVCCVSVPTRTILTVLLHVTLTSFKKER